ncbi:Hypothetical predicted protein [Mytilus galloprovincialis]|nr:Hypothetical predicted protein [Mytilus galloprovincialis]
MPFMSIQTETVCETGKCLYEGQCWENYRGIQTTVERNVRTGCLKVLVCDEGVVKVRNVCRH